MPAASASLAALPATGNCLHCGQPPRAGSRFCCAGCEQLFELLRSRGLTHFYELRDRLSFSPPRPVLRAPSFSAFGQLSGRKTIRVYIEGLHCLGCLWLLEKLPELEPSLERASLNVSSQLLCLEARAASADWDDVIRLIAELGYQAVPVDSDEELLASRSRAWRTQLLRIGVAAFSAGNIMLMSISVYGGADGPWAGLFGWASLLLALPALSYSAWPLYRSAFLPLLRGFVSVDFAVVLAILAGVVASGLHLARGAGETYFDSLTMLVFLLLSSRAFLQALREKLGDAGPFLQLLSSERYSACRAGGNAQAELRAEELRPGDRLQLRSGQILPVDATLADGEAGFDFSLLSGESEPLRRISGESVEAGARLCGEATWLQVERESARSRLAGILRQLQDQKQTRSPIVDFADRAGRHFAWTVLLAALGTIFLIPGSEGFERALALVIVTCPCVLALAVPLTMALALQQAARRGILVRDAGRLEALARAWHFVFDKTGTLTDGRFQVLGWKLFQGRPEELFGALLAIESGSSHPVARTLKRLAEAELGKGPRPEATERKEMAGLGVSGLVEGARWAAIRAPGADGISENKILVSRNSVAVAEFELGDAARPDCGAVVRELQEAGVHVSVYSGDREGPVARLAKSLGIGSWKSGLLPEQKAALIASREDTVMVGDGANDSIAFQGASVGIAMQGAMELCLRNCDIVLTRPGLAGVAEIWRIARGTRRILRSNLALTLSYNLLAGALALSGQMRPLLAAILMPMSALSVFACTSFQMRRLR